MVASDDIYTEDVDFAALAMQHAEFAKRLKANGQLDFSDPESVRQLTKALLQRDFNLHIDLPEDRLCPPVPTRFNYVVFIQRLIDSTRPDYSDGPSNDRTLGLDIGTGASAIYPLLACRQRPNWFFLATELDEKSREYAVRNVRANDLHSRIKVLAPDTQAGTEEVTILPTSQLGQFGEYGIRVQMTNPPFYASEEEMVESAGIKARPANSACTGAPVEMITPGGEVGFVTQLVRESAVVPNRTRIQWFSSMLGKFGSLAVIVGVLRDAGCDNYVVGEFVQGSKTRRWVVAWSWAGLRPPAVLARGISTLEKKWLPFPGELEVALEHADGLVVFGIVGEELGRLDLSWTPFPGEMGGIGRSRHGDVWSRKARRQRKGRRGLDQPMSDVHDGDGSAEESDEFEYDDTLPLAFKIMIVPRQTADAPDGVVVKVRWLQGHDSILFESFCGWLKRRVESHGPARESR